MTMTTILVVDDEFMVADILGLALEDEGFRIIRASNGRKALEAVEREAPALVITDYMMPLMNGIELAEAIRVGRGETAPPIILVSGAHAHIARSAGPLFAAVLDKPFRIAEIIERVHQLIGVAD